jgi:hypothetical protein
MVAGRKHPARLSCGVKRGLVGLLQNSNGLLTRHIGKTIQILVEAKAAFQIIEKAVHRHARAFETGRAAQSFRVNPDRNFRRKIICRRCFQLVLLYQIQRNCHTV